MGKKSCLTKLLCAWDGFAGKMIYALVLSIVCMSLYPAPIYLVGQDSFV
jgi:hypothetical protein